VSPVPVSTTDPGGFKTDLTWDIQMRILWQSHRYAKSGSGLSDVVVNAGYNCTLETFRYCNKPTLVTDALQHTTAYTYDAAHGGMLTETMPAPTAGAAQPQKRYTYAQRFTWVSNGAGGYGPAGSPIWVLAGMSFCKAGAPASSGTGCATAGDEVITTYDYGPDSGPNNLLLRGTVVDAGGVPQRTCMAYDAWGNKVSETKPRAGLASCP
jgi:YD repeat-containing protein